MTLGAVLPESMITGKTQIGSTAAGGEVSTVYPSRRASPAGGGLQCQPDGTAVSGPVGPNEGALHLTNYPGPASGAGWQKEHVLGLYFRFNLRWKLQELTGEVWRRVSLRRFRKSKRRCPSALVSPSG